MSRHLQTCLESFDACIGNTEMQPTASHTRKSEASNISLMADKWKNEYEFAMSKVILTEQLGQEYRQRAARAEKENASAQEIYEIQQVLDDKRKRQWRKQINDTVKVCISCTYPVLQSLHFSV